MTNEGVGVPNRSIRRHCGRTSHQRLFVTRFSQTGDATAREVSCGRRLHHFEVAGALIKDKSSPAPRFPAVAAKSSAWFAAGTRCRNRQTSEPLEAKKHQVAIARERRAISLAAMIIGPNYGRTHSRRWLA